MKHKPHAYEDAGKQYSHARTMAQYAAASQALRVLPEAESPTDQAEGRRLFEKGRQAPQ